jgi:hypothetical protein
MFSFSLLSGSLAATVAAFVTAYTARRQIPQMCCQHFLRVFPAWVVYEEKELCL